jgi:uncharacterized protein DUF6941
VYYTCMTAVGPSSQTRIEYVILADSAQTTQEGKLYLLGGGWSHILRMVPPPGSSIQAPPTQFAIAVSFLVDWNDANRPIAIRIAIEPQDERAVVQALFEVQAQVSAGRPPQATPGDPLRVLIALPILIQFPQGGSYCVRAHMDGAPREEIVRFQVNDAQMMVPPSG